MKTKTILFISSNPKKSVEEDLEIIKLTWGMAKREAKQRISWRKTGVAALSSMDRSKQRRRRIREVCHMIPNVPHYNKWICFHNFLI